MVKWTPSAELVYDEKGRTDWESFPASESFSSSHSIPKKIRISEHEERNTSRSLTAANVRCGHFETRTQRCAEPV
jgi:hypothetical protein